MRTKYGFVLFENPKEFKEWLDNQNVTRIITRIQEHHTATRVSIASNYDNLDLQNNMKTFHVQSCNFADIAQNFTIFPDGTICTGRNLNTAPAGITGANSGAICIENYGWFDKGYDEVPQVMADAIVAYTKILLDRFNLVPSSSTITYHAWWTASGTYLGDYIPGKSCKTCPGERFFGGSTMAAFNKNFLPKVKAYTLNKTNSITNTSVTNPATNTTTLSNYKITYKLNGGKNASENPVSYKKNSATITLKTPTRDNWVFGGWFTDSSFKNKITSIPKGSMGNKTLYAKWIYSQKQFISDVMVLTKTKTVKDALSKTVTISISSNSNNALVTPVERYMKMLGYYTGSIEADSNMTPCFGTGMKTAVKAYQKNIVKATVKNQDGIITASGATWKKMLGLS